MTSNSVALLSGFFALAIAGTAIGADTPDKAHLQTKAGLYLTPQEAYLMMSTSAPREVVLIDVRDPVEIAVTGYTKMVDINVPLKMIDFARWDEEDQSYGSTSNPHFAKDMEKRLKALGADRDTTLIFMCRSGGRAAAAVDIAHDLGYRNSYNMLEGFEGDKAKSGPNAGARVVNGWKNSGLPWGWELEPDVMYGLRDRNLPREPPGASNPDTTTETP
ncbi:MAG: rhodanese-like domain-containing protein [Gammaproteobacteria bacterium]